MSTAPYSTARERAFKAAHAAFGVLALVFLLLPIAVTIPLSFNSSSFLTYPLTGFSWRWYGDLLSEPAWIRSIVNSLVVGAAATALATVLGTLGAFGLFRLRSKLKPLVLGAILLPLIVPPIIIALSSYLLYVQVGLTGNVLGVVIGHTVLAVPFVVLVVYGTLQNYNLELYRAALSLGARPMRAFLVVVLPAVAPGIAGGAVLAFATSIDELVVAMFLAGPDQRTLPLQMFSGLREQLSPVITAASTLLLLFAVMVVVLTSVLRGLTKAKA